MNKIPNRKAICDVLLKEAGDDRDIIVLCSDSRGSASLAPLQRHIRVSLWRWGLQNRIWSAWLPDLRIAGKGVCGIAGLLPLNQKL